jgi:hypothetical protein
MKYDTDNVFFPSTTDEFMRRLFFENKNNMIIVNICAIKENLSYTTCIWSKYNIAAHVHC